MKRKTESIDDLIREALSAEDAEFFDRLGEQSLPEQVTETFMGRSLWFNLAGACAGTIMIVLAGVCAVNFYNAGEIRDMILWGAGLGLGTSGIILMKIWFWMEFQRNGLTREIKRLELQVAHLASELRR